MLTPSAVANAKPQANPYKLADKRGMYLLVKPDGAKWWRFDYRRPDTGKRNPAEGGRGVAEHPVHIVESRHY